MTATSASIGRLHVGTSGFSYPSWKGGFYPPGLASRDFLRAYAGRLPSVELNSTFYNLPSESTVEGWASATPPGFRFAVKMNRRIVHFGDAGLAGEFCARLRRLGERLGPIRIVIERPRDDGWLLLLAESLDPELLYAWDLRHDSWNGAELPPGVVVNAPEERGPFRYLRFRDPPYDEAALGAIAGSVRPLLAGGIDVYAYFRHEDEPTAPAYAERLLGLLGRVGE
jgi:uncharacterized protein YecE (DUF72 family)